MKKTNLFVSVFVAVLVSIATGYFIQSGQSKSYVENKETVYERVIRTGKIRCGYMIWPPYFQKDENTGELTGMLKEALDEMFSTMGISVEYNHETVLGQQSQDLEMGKYDAFCFDSYLTPKAAKFVDYSKPWMSIPMYVYGREGFAEPNDLYGLNDPAYSFSALDGDLSSDLAMRFFPKADVLSLPATADPALLLLNIATNKADVAIIDPASVFKFNKENKVKIRKLYEGEIATYPIIMSIKKGETDLQNMIDYAVDIFVHTGRYDRLFDKYDPEHMFFKKVER